jgi:hypothetical protein
MTLFRRYESLLRSTERRRNQRSPWQTAPNEALQADKVKLSCLLQSQKSHQLDFAVELGRQVRTRSRQYPGRRE